MFPMTGGIFRWFALLLLGLVLGGCGGGGGDGGFAGTDTMKVSITADKTILQTNPTNAGPNPAGPFTNTLTVQVKKNDRLFPAPSVAIDIVSGLPSGALFYLDGDEEHEDDDGNPLAFRRLTFEDTTGTVTAHFHASGTPGTVILRASAADPDTNETIVADLTITVGPGVSTGLPALVGLVVDSSPLYIAGQGRQEVKRFQVQVLDDAGQPVPNPAGNNLRLQLLPNRPNGGERLSAISAGGGVQEGEVVNTRTINGVAEVALHSGTLPGTVAIAAIADRADNNVDNGIQNSVTDVDTIPISSGEIASLTFTGPYPGAVAQRRNTLPLGDGDDFESATGIYSRKITVIAADEFGAPPAPGKFVTFRLMDGPMTGYPDEGRGEFTIAGTDGNPQEGGNTFSTPGGGSSLAGTRVNCQLVLEGGPGQVGGWIVTGVSGPSLLSVSTPFNAVTDTGFTVPYTVGCPPYAGNVANDLNGVTIQLDANGLASTIMNYPITQLGRNFKMTAEASGGRVGAVLSAWYLGIPEGSTLTVVPASDQNLRIPVGGTLTKTLSIQLFDGAEPPAPLPAEVLSVQVVVTDPDRDAAVAAENAVAAAEAVLAAVTASNPAGCKEKPPGEGDPEEDARCASWRDALVAAQDALTKARSDLAAAQARDALHEPTAEFSPDPLITGANGIAAMTVTVSDLYTGASTGGTGDAKVEFFITTVGPEIRAETLVITVLPQGAATEE